MQSAQSYGDLLKGEEPHHGNEQTAEETVHDTHHDALVTDIGRNSGDEKASTALGANRVYESDPRGDDAIYHETEALPEDHEDGVTTHHELKEDDLRDDYAGGTVIPDVDGHNDEVEGDVAAEATGEADSVSTAKKMSDSTHQKPTSLRNPLDPTSPAPLTQSSPSYSPVPFNSDPTHILLNRFTAWRNILKDLVAYFKNVAAVEDAHGRNLAKLSSTLGFPNSKEEGYFVNEGGIHSIGTLMRDHSRQCSQNSANIAKLVETVIVPHLETLGNELNGKLKAIKRTQPDFRNNISQQQSMTQRLIADFNDTLALSKASNTVPAARDDPHLTRMALDRQLYSHIQEENNLHASFQNSEKSGRHLEERITLSINEAFEKYGLLLDNEVANTTSLDQAVHACANLPPEKEWDDFLNREHALVKPVIKLRSVDDLEYNGKNEVTKIRDGQMERKSKYLKSYSRAYYILTTLGYMHEFKTKQAMPKDLAMSIFLPQCQMGEHSAANATSHKFAIKGTKTGVHAHSSWVFRCASHQGN